MILNLDMSIVMMYLTFFFFKSVYIAKLKLLIKILVEFLEFSVLLW